MSEGRLWLLRHAERPPLPADGTGDELELTGAGREQARRWGADRRGEIASVQASPIRRADETAALIAAGAGLVAPSHSTWLGAHGPFVRDPGPAWAAFQELGAKGLIRRLLQGDPGEAFHDPKAAAWRFASAVVEPASAAGGLHVAVSHDLIIAGLLGALLGGPIDDAHWPGFLEGPELTLLAGGDRLRIRYRGQTYEVERPPELAPARGA